MANVTKTVATATSESQASKSESVTTHNNQPAVVYTNGQGQSYYKHSPALTSEL